MCLAITLAGLPACVWSLLENTVTQFQGVEYGRNDRISVSEFIYKEEMTSLDSGLSLIFAACSLACFDEASCHIGSCLWRDSSGKQLRVASSQQPRRNLILPTAMWLNLETAHSPAERLEMLATQTRALAAMCEWARSQRTQFSCTWTPELQTRWENTGCRTKPESGASSHSYT